MDQMPVPITNEPAIHHPLATERFAVRTRCVSSRAVKDATVAIKNDKATSQKLYTKLTIIIRPSEVYRLIYRPAKYQLIHEKRKLQPLNALIDLEGFLRPQQIAQRALHFVESFDPNE